jgi:hypothetical protein
MFFVKQNVVLMLCFPFAVAAIGCGTTATITRVNGPQIEAKIVGGDETKLYVQNSSAGDSTSIARNDVTDIDHPGNVAALIGGVVSAYGVVNVVAGAPQCERKGAAYCTGVFLPAAIGLPIMMYGLYNWMDSTSAAKPNHGKATASVSVLPVASLQKKNEFFGANLVVTY